MAHQQDRALRFADEFHGLGDLGCPGALIDKPIPVGRQRFCHIELFENDMRRVLDIDGTGRAGHRLADRFVDDLVGLVGVLDGGAVFDRGCEKRFLADELDTAAPHPAFGDAGPLTAEEDHRRVLHFRALDRTRDVGHARAQRADAQTGPTGHPRGRLGHEARAEFVVRGDHRPSTRVGLGEHVHEVGVGDAEQGVHPFGLEQVEDALVDGHRHDGKLLYLQSIS